MTQSDSAREFLDRPLKDVSIEDLCQLFLASAKPATESLVGLEVELFGVDARHFEPVPHSILTGVLERLGDLAGMTPEFEGDGFLVGLRGQGALVSLEPGGQLEFATRPHRALHALLEEVEAYARTLSQVGREQGVRFWAVGHHPLATRDRVPKMPKARYEIMREFLATRGSRGLDMMHLTCSVQTTVDFDSERDLVDKMRTAARVSPFVAALTASSPFSGGRPNGYRSMRYQIWQDTDPLRAGIWPEMLDVVGLTPFRYVERALETPAMFFIRGGSYRRAEPRPFASFGEAGFDGTTVTVADFVDHLTTFFPEIRMKGYLELRGADCLMPKEAVALAGFWRGLLEDEATRRAVDDRLTNMGYEELRALQPQVARSGLDAMSPAGPVREIALWLVQAAYDRLARAAPDCAECVLPLLGRAERGLSPADEMLLEAGRSSVTQALESMTI